MNKQYSTKKGTNSAFKRNLWVAGFAKPRETSETKAEKKLRVRQDNYAGSFINGHPGYHMPGSNQK